MKIILLTIQLLVICSSVFSQQCPPSALKIQSPVCDTPKNLRVNAITCSSVKLNWKGNKEQTYIVEATGIDAAANTIFQVKAAEYSCDENGNCSATIPVKEEARVDWNVQAVCLINEATIYSPKIAGKQALIPTCQSVTQREGNNNAETSETIRVYPNPTTGYLTVEYYSKAAGTLQLNVVDMAGKKVFNQSNSVVTGANKYRLNLRSLLPGSYTLEAVHNMEVSRIKFVLVRN